jgi:hypothetical protein
MEFVSWGYYSQYMEKQKMFQITNQIDSWEQICFLGKGDVLPKNIQNQCNSVVLKGVDPQR